jgi:virginiamycin B lyase
MRRLGLIKVVLASVIAGLALPPAGAAAAAAPKGPPLCRTDCATAFVPPIAAMPFGITRGPLGSVWFSLDSPFTLNSVVGRVDRQGRITTYPVPSANAWVGWMTTHPGNTVWFAERGMGKIGRVTANGAITEFSLSTRNALPQGIVFAPDGNIYVSEQGANAIARLNPVTGQATDIPVPTPNATVQSGALGPDGAIWFIERSADKVGRMTLDGHFTEYPLTPGAFPNRIVTGPDGALWFTELNANRVGRITTGGVLSEHPVAGGPVGITVGRDRQLYVDLFNARAVARVKLTGEVTGQWALPGAGGPLLITTGFGLDIWVTDTLGGKIYRLTPYATGS